MLDSRAVWSYRGFNSLSFDYPIAVMPLNAAHAWGHTGETLGYAAVFMTIPEKDTNSVYMTNRGSCNAALLPSAIKEPLLDG